MRKMSNRAFTIVELIIVIAVIGVLATILIPTFSNIIEAGNARSALSDARSTVTQFIIMQEGQDILPMKIVIFVHKAKKFYIYSYTTWDATLRQSDGNNFIFSSVDDLISTYNYKGVGVPTGDSYDLETDGAFYLVPLAERNTTTMKGEPLSGAGFVNLNAELQKLPSSVTVFYGKLLPGTTVSIETMGSGSAQSGS